MTPLPLQTRKGRKKHQNSKLGCQDCRSRRIKCGEEIPSCCNCIDRKISCSFLQLAPEEIESRRILKKKNKEAIARTIAGMTSTGDFDLDAAKLIISSEYLNGNTFLASEQGKKIANTVQKEELEYIKSHIGPEATKYMKPFVFYMKLNKNSRVSKLSKQKAPNMKNLMYSFKIELEKPILPSSTNNLYNGPSNQYYPFLQDSVPNNKFELKDQYNTVNNIPLQQPPQENYLEDQLMKFTYDNILDFDKFSQENKFDMDKFSQDNIADINSFLDNFDNVVNSYFELGSKNVINDNDFILGSTNFKQKVSNPIVKETIILPIPSNIKKKNSFSITNSNQVIFENNNMIQNFLLNQDTSNGLTETMNQNIPNGLMGTEILHQNMPNGLMGAEPIYQNMPNKIKGAETVHAKINLLKHSKGIPSQIYDYDMQYKLTGEDTEEFGKLRLIYYTSLFDILFKATQYDFLYYFTIGASITLLQNYFAIFQLGKTRDISHYTTSNLSRLMKEYNWKSKIKILNNPKVCGKIKYKLISQDIHEVYALKYSIYLYQIMEIFTPSPINVQKLSHFSISIQQIQTACKDIKLKDFGTGPMIQYYDNYNELYSSILNQNLKGLSIPNININTLIEFLLDLKSFFHHYKTYKSHTSKFERNIEVLVELIEKLVDFSNKVGSLKGKYVTDTNIEILSYVVILFLRLFPSEYCHTNSIFDSMHYIDKIGCLYWLATAQIFKNLFSEVKCLFMLDFDGFISLNGIDMRFANSLTSDLEKYLKVGNILLYEHLMRKTIYLVRTISYYSYRQTIWYRSLNITDSEKYLDDFAKNIFKSQKFTNFKELGIPSMKKNQIKNIHYPQSISKDSTLSLKLNDTGFDLNINNKTDSNNLFLAAQQWLKSNAFNLETIPLVFLSFDKFGLLKYFDYRPSLNNEPWFRENNLEAENLSDQFLKSLKIKSKILNQKLIETK